MLRGVPLGGGVGEAGLGELLLDQEAEAKKQMGKAEGDMAVASGLCEAAQAGLSVYT